ncbi:uncharacterized protein LOC119595304 [Penaeus monodon]|uniref:uncharacterized protein LOC119595304 n=1 Tax=Penaeus monodon TaxID=6687 RepID=UPI0018A6D4CB|nr:uncharacterized protein LOC119595304 [Penaeus monodon]
MVRSIAPEPPINLRVIEGQELVWSQGVLVGHDYQRQYHAAYRAYLPTTSHADEDTEKLHEHIDNLISNSEAQFKIVMGDFNAKVRLSATKMYFSGDSLINFAERHQLKIWNTFFKKRPSRRWAWISPNSTTKNEIDYILTNRPRIFTEVSVLNSFNTGSDYCFASGSMVTHTRLERAKLLKRPRKKTKPPKPHKLSTETKQLREMRRQMKRGGTNVQDIEYAEVCKAIRHCMRKEVTKHDEKQLEALEQSRGPTFIKKLSNDNLHSEGRDAVKRQKRGKAPGEDIVAAEIQHGGEPIVKMLTKLFNRCLHLLSCDPRVISCTLAHQQAIQQAGFRSGFSTLDHIQVVTQLQGKANEYKIPLYLAFMWRLLTKSSSSHVSRR